jgi:uncharacterized protein (DUF2249 family)
MKKLLLLLLFTSSLFAQNEPQLQWAHKQSNPIVGGSIAITSSTKDDSGNVYFIGTFSNKVNFDPLNTSLDLTSSAPTDIFFAKYSPNGNCLWAKNLTGSGTLTPKAIEFGGNAIYIAGTFSSSMDIDASSTAAINLVSNGENDIFMAKYDLSGNYMVGKSIGGTLSEDIYDLQFSLNQIHITGLFSETVDFDPSNASFDLTVSAGASDGFVAKYSDTLQLTFAFSVSGDGVENISSIDFDGNGGLFITGNTSGTTDFDPSPATNTLVTTSIRISFIAYYTNFGSFVWVKNIGGKSSSSIYPVKIIAGTDSALYTVGQFNLTSDFDPSAATATITPSNSDLFIAKYDTNGNYLWAGKIGSTSTDTLTSFDIDNANNLYLTGAMGAVTDFDTSAASLTLDPANGTGFLAKYNSAGTVTYAYNLSTTGTKVIVDSPSAILNLYGSFTGYRDFDLSASTSFFYTDITNSFFSRYTLDAGYGYTKQIGNYATVSSTTYVATDVSGFVYNSGNFGNTLDLNPSAATTNVTSGGWTDFYISKYAPTGDLVWAKSISGPLFNGVNAMNTDPNGNIYVMGRFLGTVDFDPSANIANLVSTNNVTTDVFIAKYDTNGNFLWAKKFDGNFTVSDIKFDPNGNLYYLARFSGTVDLDPSPTNTVSYTSVGIANLIFSKFNPQGDMVWANAIQSVVTSPGGINETHLFVNANAILVSGFFTGDVDFNPSPTQTAILSASLLEGCVAKYDLNGNYQLVNQYTASTNCIITNALLDSDNNLIVVSYFEGDFDFDLSTGTNILSSTGSDIGIAKYNPNGALIWAKATQGLNQDLTNGINFRDTQAFLDEDNSIILNGVFFGVYDFDPSANIDSLSSYFNPTTLAYNGNVFVAKYNYNGDLITADQLTGQYGSTVTSAAFTANHDLLFTGTFNGTIDFDFTATAQNQTSQSLNYSDRYFAKYSVNTLSNNTNELGTNSYTVYPNPTQNILNIYNPSLALLDITITDITGKVVLQKNNTNETQLNVANYPQGMYFVTLTNQQNNTKTTLKFIKE